LSPTPAVLGYPSKDALTDIERFEVHPRFCYSGFVGTCDKKGYHFYVNLRCAHFSQDRVCAYAGGGLTAKSNPNDEWNETFYKLLPLLDTMILYG
jgi:isochorismate synthase